MALKILNKVIIRKNPELNNYTENKILARLQTFAVHNHDEKEERLEVILNRGATIFGPDERDSKNSKQFLILLLECIEKWS